MKPTDLNRRDFLQATGTAAGALWIAANATSARAAGSNGRLRIGFIGPGGRGFSAHVKSLARLKNDGRNIELVALADVYSVQRDKVADYIKEQNGNVPAKYEDYREMIAKEDLDAVAIGSPDHWHHKHIVDSLNAGLHVYAEKPMTKTVEQALDVVKIWKKSGRVMQVGVQATSQPLWNGIRAMVDAGKLGKMLMYQTEYFRNSSMGQWRYYQLKKEMTPKTINWAMWLGKEEGLAPGIDFDREIYAQWRRFWPFGSGMYTDLFVHRVTMMLKATGLRWPGRVVGAGGLYLEYDGRTVPDVATVAADYPEGVHGLISSTMCNEESRLRKVIRGHFGSFLVDDRNHKVEFLPERPQVTRNSKLQAETFSFEPTDRYAGLRNWSNMAHFVNWLDAIEAGAPAMCNNPADLGAAAVATVILGAQSYREGKVFHFDPEKGSSEADNSWATRWEERSAQRGKPEHVSGWTAGDYGSLLEEPSYMSLAGPWKNGKPPSDS